MTKINVLVEGRADDHDCLVLRDMSMTEAITFHDRNVNNAGHRQRATTMNECKSGCAF